MVRTAVTWFAMGRYGLPKLFFSADLVLHITPLQITLPNSPPTVSLAAQYACLLNHGESIITIKKIHGEYEVFSSDVPIYFYIH